MVDKDEEENGPVMEAAYKEFEDSITSIKNPNKDIKFIIYKYEVAAKKACIRKSRVSLCRYRIKTIEEKPVEDFYAEGHPHLVDFFDQYVAKKSIKENEEHKHFFIVWGHAAGLGFLASRIKNNLKKAFEDKKTEASINSIFHNILKYNFLRAHLSFEVDENSNHPIFDNPSVFGGENKLLELTTTQKELLTDTLKVITAKELAKVIKRGLEKDIVSVASKGDKAIQGPKVQVMACLSCYVNMIETGFELTEMINIYVSPQTTISFYGYNYKELFTLLASTPYSNERQIVRNITDYYLIKYSDIQSDVINEVNYRKDVAFSGVYLQEYKSIAEKIGNFVVYFFKLLADNACVTECLKLNITDVLQRAREKCLPVTKDGAVQYGVIDYNNLLVEFFQLFFSPDPESDNFILEHQIIANYYPGNLAQSRIFIDDNNKYKSQSPGSFSIFFPSDNPTEIEQILGAIYVTTKGPKNFLGVSRWDELLKELKVISYS